MLALHREKKKHFYGAKIRILSVIAYCSLCFSFFLFLRRSFREKKLWNNASCFSFLENLFRITRNEINNFVICFLGTYRTTICEIFFF